MPAPAAPVCQYDITINISRRGINTISTSLFRCETIYGESASSYTTRGAHTSRALEAARAAALMRAHIIVDGR